MASPLHLFLLPAFLLLVLGTLMLLSGLFSLSVSENYSIGPHWMILGGGLCLIGLQTGQFGILARLYSHVHWFSEDDPGLNTFLRIWTVERGIAIAITLMVVGFIGDAFVLEEWLSGGFGPLHRITQALLSTVTLAIGIQVFFFTFLFEILNGGQSK